MTYTDQGDTLYHECLNKVEGRYLKFQENTMDALTLLSDFALSDVQAWRSLRRNALRVN